MWAYLLVVEQDAVERPVHPVIDIVCTHIRKISAKHRSGSLHITDAPSASPSLAVCRAIMFAASVKAPDTRKHPGSAISSPAPKPYLLPLPKSEDGSTAASISPCRSTDTRRLMTVRERVYPNMLNVLSDRYIQLCAVLGMRGGVLGMWGHVPGWWTATRVPGEVSGWVDTL